MNEMRKIRIEKLTLNIGAGKDRNVLNKGLKLLKQISAVNPTKTITKKRIAAWALRPGLPIGCKVTLRRQPATELLMRLLTAKENLLKESNFDDNGNISFGIAEYIDIPEVNYDPEIGIIGLQASISLERPGFRIKKRKIMKRKITHRHKITKEDAMEFMKEKFKIKLQEKIQNQITRRRARGIKMTTSDHKKVLNQIQGKPAKIARFKKYNVPKDRAFGKMTKRCVRCGRTGGHISKYGINVCRQCFREIALELGFKKFS
jgi:large subunit ribosomal protein L5